VERATFCCKKRSNKELLGFFRKVALISATVLFATPLALTQAVAGSIINAVEERPGDPTGMYGGCLPGNPSAGVSNKAHHVEDAGMPLGAVRSIEVIDCHGFDGPGGSAVAPCPAGSSYTYCVLNQNDGVGNHIFLGVVATTVGKPCVLGASRTGPPAQIDIVFFAPAIGIQTIEYRGGVNNALTQTYAVGSDRDPIIVTVTKVNQAQTASLPQILVTDESGTISSCNFSF
jgi:hypothetical protein